MLCVLRRPYRLWRVQLQLLLSSQLRQRTPVQHRMSLLLLPLWQLLLQWLPRLPRLLPLLMVRLLLLMLLPLSMQLLPFLLLWQLLL